MGRIDVRIVEARNLPNMTTFDDASSPYATVELENNKYETMVAEKKANPKWDKIFKFTVADPSSARLVIKIYHKGLTSDDFIGEYRLNIDGLTRGVEKTNWYILQQCKTNAEIKITLLAIDFGQEPASPTAVEGEVVGQVVDSHHGSWSTNNSGSPNQAQVPPPQPAAQFAQPQWSPEIQQTRQPTELEMKLAKAGDSVGKMFEGLVKKIDNNPSGNKE